MYIKNIIYKKNIRKGINDTSFIINHSKIKKIPPTIVGRRFLYSENLVIASLYSLGLRYINADINSSTIAHIVLADLPLTIFAKSVLDVYSTVFSVFGGEE